MAEMKWHIMLKSEDGKEQYPLLWEEEILEFDTEQAAKEFYESVIEITGDVDCLGPREDVEILEGIMYWDGGHLNATNMRYHIEGEEEMLVIID